MEYIDVIKQLEENGAMNMFTFHLNGYVVFFSTHQKNPGIDLVVLGDMEIEMVRESNKTLSEVEEILDRFTDGLPHHVRDKYYLNVAYEMGRTCPTINETYRN